MPQNRLTTILGIVALALLGYLVFMVNSIMRHEQSVDDRLAKLESIVRSGETVNYTNRDVDCLTKNIYYEAGNQDDVGTYAVATVTLNRLKTGVWGNSVCKVVYAPAQFSWTLLRKLNKPDPTLYARSREVAIMSLQGHRVYGLEHSLLYHADYIRTPNWADVRERVGKIGVHVFYNRGKGSSIEI